MNPEAATRGASTPLKRHLVLRPDFPLDLPMIGGVILTLEMAEKQGRLVTIGNVAKAVAVDRRTIRYYERRGLLNCSRTPSRYRLFGERELLKLKLIRSLRRLDFSIPEIARLLPVLLKPRGLRTSSASALKELLNQRLHRVEEQLKELTTVHQTLTQRVGRLAALKTACQDSCCEPFCGPETCAPRFIQIKSMSSNRNRGKEVAP